MVRTKKIRGQNTYRYVFLANYDEPKELSTILHGRIRALHLEDCSKTELNDDTFSSAKRLCLGFKLLLHEEVTRFYQSTEPVKISSYPMCSGWNDSRVFLQVIKLNYLSLDGSPEMSKLPESIARLEALTCLKLSGCSQLLELPESFGKLKYMEHLNLSACSQLSFGYLESLTRLNLSACSVVLELPESFRKLKNLEHLDLSNFTNVKDVFENFGGLYSRYGTQLYGRRRLPEALGNLSKLQYLDLSLEISNLQMGKEASQVRLGWVMRAKSGLNSNFLGSLTELKYLNLSGCPDMVVLPESFGNLENLVDLNLSGC
uniref:NB-ARC domain-containing protein n=1 Tax=Leersia perrieri TaxID=77586 RepID=A0A0D9WES6_9ORYZ